MTKQTKKSFVAALVVLGAGAAWAGDGYNARELRAIYDSSVRYTQALSFPNNIQGDVADGQARFGVTPDDRSIDTSQALFGGVSVIYGQVVPNGTACSTCHRPDSNFLLPPPPISQHVPAGDPLFFGRLTAEAQGDPRAAAIFENFGLLKNRSNRFNPAISEDDVFRKVFNWRKTQTIINTVFAFGLLTDGRARTYIEQARAAAFNHTQDTDTRFDDLVNPFLTNISAYEATEVQPPILKDLLDPSSANYQRLVDDPFFSVHTSTDLEEAGKQVFVDNCMSCHNVPNVFSNVDHVNGPPANFPPLYGHTYDIGVAQRNKLGLDYRYYDTATGAYSTLVLPLAREDGTRIDVRVVDDVGAAGSTGRYEDLHRFKVPQLRMISKLGPYFHDNSAATLADVVDYFNSEWYNRSPDGRQHPIHLDPHQRAALLAFLNVL